MEHYSKYLECGKIHKRVMDTLISYIKPGMKTVDICNYGNNLILENTRNIFKNSLKGINLPVCISLNNCVGYYYHTDDPKFNTIKVGDIVKIEFGIYIDECIVGGGDTIKITECETGERESSERLGEGTNSDKYIELLGELESLVVSNILPNTELVESAFYEENIMTNDDIRIIVESKCTELNCFPIQNCKSYQQPHTSDSKTMFLNYRKIYDSNDCLINEDNMCFDFDKGDVYYINLTIIPGESQKLYTKDQCNIIKINKDFNCNLRIRSSRKIYDELYRSGGEYFYSDTYLNRLGISDCLRKDFIEKEPIYYSTSEPVYHKKFTVFVTEKRCKKMN